MNGTDEAAEWLTHEMREIRRRVRAVPGLTINAVLQRADIAYSTWWRWEQYTRGNPSGQLPRMDRIARVKNTVAAIEAEQAPQQ